MNIITWVVIGIIIYLIINLVMYFIQEKFIFHPERLPHDFEFKYDIPFEEYFFDIKRGVRINAVHFKVDNPRGLVLYFHGNTRSIKGWGKYAKHFTVHGFEVFMFDYRGFGKSTGKRSEKALKEDAQFVYDELKKKYDEKDIIIYGRSIGSGFATKLASMNNPRLLILDAPYFSFSKLTSQYLPFLPIAWILRYPIKTFKWIKYVRCPIRIIHGTQDKIIPFKASIELAEAMPIHTRLIPIIGGGHNNLPTFQEYHTALKAILLEKL
ncbi:MAG: lysophospholipase [Microscillaceae bacterium]|nr:lysophospholipase [Microscillaceae bacterium]MDW8461890.1 alpha/beta fold hydrolase [Cytophagales bacterium]